jgi:glutathione S-transferase
VHPAHAHHQRPERYATDAAHFPNIQETGRKAFHGYLQQVDGLLAGRQWLSDSYSVLDPYALTFYAWGVRRELPMREMKNLHGVLRAHDAAPRRAPHRRGGEVKD